MLISKYTFCDYFQNPRETFQELQEIEREQETDCYDLECVANDQCCPGQVCFILDSSEYNTISFFTFSKFKLNCTCHILIVR